MQRIREEKGEEKAEVEDIRKSGGGGGVNHLLLAPCLCYIVLGLPE